MIFDLPKNEQNQSPKLGDLSSLQVADEIIEKIQIEKSLILKQALDSDNVDNIYKARNYLAKYNKESTSDTNKTMIIDPMSINLGLGYQDKSLNLSLAILRGMGRVPIIKSIVGTRIDQVINFAQPQEDKYSTGFVVRPKKVVRGGDGEIKLSKEQEKKIEFITEFILNCGTKDVDIYNHDTFENFLKKWLKDSLELDQGTFDTPTTVGGDLYSFKATDGATFRIADTFFKQFDEEYKERHESEYVNGYLPFYVQIYQSRVINEYFPWEMAFAIRNPQTDIFANGYGRSELEDLIQTVTNILNADQYNANYFKVGSNPKGILRVTGNVNTSRLEEFRNQWQTQMAGAKNAHKMPIIEADKMDFINTQASNKDMEYGKYYEFLIKLGCAVYRIDPSEINFPLNGSSEQKSLFDSSNAAKIKNSKDKGLKPLLRFVQAKMNKHVVERIDPDYQLLFLGLEEEDREKEVEDIIKKVQNVITVDEARRKLGLKDFPDKEIGGMILNPQLMSMLAQEKMAKQAGDQNSNQYIDDEYGKEQEEENPFLDKAFAKEISKILESDVELVK